MKTLIFGITIVSLALASTSAAQGQASQVASMTSDIINSANGLADLIIKAQGFVDSVMLREINTLVRRLNGYMDELTVDEKAMTKEALVKLKIAQGKLAAIRITLRVLSSETVRKTNLLKRILARITSETRDNVLLNKLKAIRRTFSRLMGRSKTLLRESKDMMRDLLNDLSYATGRIEAFTTSVANLWNRESTRYDAVINKLREEAYGGSAACMFSPVSCPVVYAMVAPIIETKINDYHNTVENLRRSCNDAKSKAVQLKTKVETSYNQCIQELEIIQRWDSAVHGADEMTDSMETINMWIENDMKDEIVTALDHLIDVCQEYTEATD